MSAMTGPRSPTSPWHQESDTLLSSHSRPTAFFPLSDSRPSPFNKISPRVASEVPDSNYFSFNLESPSLLKNRDHLSPVQANESPEGQLITGKGVQYINAKEVESGMPPAVYRLSLNRAIGKGDEYSKRQSLSTQPAETTGASGRPVSIEHCAELLESSANDVMVLDVRPYAHFSRGNIQGALNLCIPTTLLKRPSFDTKKLANTFTDEADRVNFARWKICRYIIIYDAATSSLKDAGPLINVLKKFSTEGWTGDGLILMGGFRAFANKFPQLTQQQQQQQKALTTKTSPMQIDLPQSAPVAGGCNIPESSSAAIPFFGNIRQNMDLVGGVGQIALKHSEHLSEPERQSLPPWLCQVSDPSDQGRMAASRFFDIEKTELDRMKQALSYDNNNTSTKTSTFRVAGIEKGTKNRYNDIYPYDHTRVRLADIPAGGCDYVNASFLKAEHSDRYYIATQAPVPDTFNDFWRVVWEQDIRLVVSLTAEVERGQVKCHPYWRSGTYGPFHVNNFSKQYIAMEPVGSPQTNPRTPVDSEKSKIVVRHFGLSHSEYPFEPLREVTQLQYPDWPDFGTTSQPRHLLQLIEQCDKVRTATAKAAPGNPKRPVLVHCSAGCGRTGTFCTVDSVLDVMQRQNIKEHEGHSPEPWLGGGHLDLVAKTVSDFRTQRPSVVQNLSQFVLCYESVLEWAVDQGASNF
ncbi:protein-tyrosine phosphatase-like protein [Aspergillus heterothallicus]